MIKKPKYLIHAEQTYEKSIQKYNDTINSPEFQKYLNNRQWVGLPDASKDDLYRHFLRARQMAKYRAKKKKNEPKPETEPPYTL